MIGAIIGDLAAWTWENDHEAFYPKLISEKAMLSDYSKMLLAGSSMLMTNLDMDYQEYKAYFENQPHSEWSMKYTVLRAIVIGWLAARIKDVPVLCQKFALNIDKEDWYASHFTALLISVLRFGATKKEALRVNHVGEFEHFLNSNWEKGDDNSPLGYLVRVWKAFTISFDFGSAIHNAIKLPGDRHFNCILMGALADAMYGHERYIIKKQFGDGRYLKLDKWVDIETESYYSLRRIFYPKNRADTNVERHHYRKVVNPFAFIKISKSDHDSILRAYEPNMMNPYGFYLEDGWIYLYRDSVILGRFETTQINDGWRISTLQATDDVPFWAFLDAMAETINCCEGVYNDEFYKVISPVIVFGYFDGRDNPPKEWKGGINVDYWYGERMFLETGQSLNYWQEEARKFRQENILPDKIKNLDDNSLGIALYIDLQMSKWNPYSDMNYILSYKTK